MEAPSQVMQEMWKEHINDSYLAEYLPYLSYKKIQPENFSPCFYSRLVFPYLILFQYRQNKGRIHYFGHSNSIAYLQEAHDWVKA